ncbi:glycoside hydrolase family 32 protein [Coprobacillaceae bacterium CR2/5/TPMF4]|nr:glycoside hydrolase family 32 protein [Coprobacillaceae bacterium CR2/5/TPMF4]
MHPKYHLTAPKHWINDPNGFIYYRGNYHLFYQYFPYENRWGTMHWGHAISKDLINWQDLGIALYPSKNFDANGCFSGSSIKIDGKMYIYYTSVRYTKTNPENIHTTLTGDEFLSSQSMIISEDGFKFDNLNSKK